MFDVPEKQSKYVNNCIVTRDPTLFFKMFFGG
jgi:hypothetical protein